DRLSDALADQLGQVAHDRGELDHGLDEAGRSSVGVSVEQAHQDSLGCASRTAPRITRPVAPTRKAPVIASERIEYSLRVNRIGPVSPRSAAGGVLELVAPGKPAAVS